MFYTKKGVFYKTSHYVCFTNDKIDNERKLRESAFEHVKYIIYKLCKNARLLPLNRLHYVKSSQWPPDEKQNKTNIYIYIYIYISLLSRKGCIGAYWPGAPVAPASGAEPPKPGGFGGAEPPQR